MIRPDTLEQFNPPHQLPDSRVGRAVGTILLSTVMLYGLSACDSGNEAPPKVSEVVTTYRGRDLLCRSYLIKDTFPDKEMGYNCDFAGFYASPTYTAPSGTKRLGADVLKEQVVPYESKPLHCLVYAVTKKDVPDETCDFVRLHDPALE